MWTRSSPISGAGWTGAEPTATTRSAWRRGSRPSSRRSCRAPTATASTRPPRRHVDGLFEDTQAIGVDVEATSRIPGGALLHGAAGRIIQRHTGQLADATRTVLWDMATAMREVQHLIDAQRTADERQLKEVIASVIDRIALLDHVATAIVDLERRVDARERPQPPSA